MTKKEMLDYQLSYIRNYYNMPFLKIGMKVKCRGVYGVIVGATEHIKIKDRAGRVWSAHPTWHIAYYDKNDNVIEKYQD